MSKINSSVLTEDEIEEELINNDLISSGGVDSQTILQQMDLEEKKNLLLGIQQSKEDFQKEPPVSSRPLKKPIIIDTSKSEFPSLNEAAKSNKLKLPRSSASKQVDSDEGKDQCISLVDDDDDDDDDDESLFTKTKKFSLPYCVSDNAPALPMPDRALRREKCPYYQQNGERAYDSLRRMLSHHDEWKNKFIAETSKLESQATVENIQDSNDKESINEKDSDNETDPYNFTEVTKVYSGPGLKKRETNKTLDNVPPLSSRTLQRRASRDSDCEEIQPTLKPEEPKLSEWMTAPRPRNKRNRKQLSNQGKAQSQPDVEFEFDRSLWEGGRSSGGPQSPAPARRSLPSVREAQEEKVQCPICQRDYLRSIVENHAATCEGFSSSPMDVEEGM